MGRDQPFGVPIGVLDLLFLLLRLVFSAMLLARTIPRDNEAVRGMIDGAHAAILKVGQLRGTSIGTAVPTPSPA